MRQIHLSWHRYNYFPYEIDLAKREIEAVFGVKPQETDHGLSFELNGHQPELARRLTYARSARLPDGRDVTTDQARLEDSAKYDVDVSPMLASNRQSTRYSAHGLHEYRGKFNPQVVRAIGNILGLEPGSWVLDPFCGSGTTLLECAHSGWHCYGVDMNPLAVLISNAKLQAFDAPIDELTRISVSLNSVLAQRTAGLNFDEDWTERTASKVAGHDWMKTVSNADYLIRWFPRSVLAQLAAILQAIAQHSSVSDFLHVLLSDLARKASYQDPGDLRIRRRSDARPNYPVIPWYLKALDTRIGVIARARRVVGRVGQHRAFLGDSRQALDWLLADGQATIGRFDAAITSPPYATALPYIDTQRLSLALLGLIDARHVMHLDQQLIGTREIRPRERGVLESQISSDSCVPKSVRTMCAAMLEELERSHVDGFRRRNMPALVFKYFRDMGLTLANIATVMKDGGSLAIVVGRNRTVLNGKPFTVDTPEILTEVGELHGWKRAAILELDTYQRFDLHQRNSIRTECLVVLKRRS